MCDVERVARVVAHPRRVTMPKIISICEAVTGHVDLVPCRLCTGFVSRSQLELGLLPEETHHSAEELCDFYSAEKQRRDDMKRELSIELQALRKAATLAGASYHQDRGDTAKSIRKKPAAATRRTYKSVMKRPAARAGKNKGTK